MPFGKVGFFHVGDVANSIDVLSSLHAVEAVYRQTAAVGGGFSREARNDIAVNSCRPDHFIATDFGVVAEVGKAAVVAIHARTQLNLYVHVLEVFQCLLGRSFRHAGQQLGSTLNEVDIHFLTVEFGIILW